MLNKELKKKMARSTAIAMAILSMSTATLPTVVHAEPGLGGEGIEQQADVGGSGSEDNGGGGNGGGENNAVEHHEEAEHHDDGGNQEAGGNENNDNAGNQGAQAAENNGGAGNQGAQGGGNNGGAGNQDVAKDYEQIDGEEAKNGAAVEGFENLDKNEVNGKDKEVKQLDKLTLQDLNEEAKAHKKAQAEKAKARKKFMKECANEGGTIAGKLLVEAMTKNYKDSGDKTRQLTEHALKMIVETFGKKIPIVGGFATEVAKGVLGITEEETATEKKLGELKDGLKDIDGTIKDGVNDMMNQQNSFNTNKNVQEINKYFKSYKKNCDYAHKVYDGISNSVKESLNDEDANLDAIPGEYSKIYDPSDTKTDKKDDGSIRGKIFFDNYMDYSDLLMNKGKLIKGNSNLVDNVFTAYEKSIDDSSKKDGKYRAIEYKGITQDLIKQIKDGNKMGYTLLNKAITFEKSRLETLSKDYTESKAALQKKLKENKNLMTADEIQAIKAAIREIDGKRKACNTKLVVVNDDLKKLNDKNEEVLAFVKAKEDAMKAQEDEFAKVKQTESIDVACRKRSAETVKVGPKGHEKEIKVYPNENKAKKVVEYRDQYGSLIGTRKINSPSKVGQYEVKENEVYHFKAGFCAKKAMAVTDHVTERDVKVTSVFESPRYLAFGGKASIFKIGTTRCIKGIDCKTNKEVTIEIGGGEGWDITETTLGDFVKASHIK